MAQNTTPTNVNVSLLGCLRPILFVILLIAGIYYGLNYWHSISVPDYIRSSSSFNAWALNLTKIEGGYTKEGPVVWLFSYYRHGKNMGYTYQMHIIDPQKKALIKRHFFNQTSSITSTSDMSDFSLLKNQMFSANQALGIQWRNLKTGEIEGNEQSLIQKFPQLRAGIGQISRYSSNEQIYNITTKDGLKYQYFADLDKITTEEEKEKIRQDFYKQDIADFKFAKLSYAWSLSGDELRKELILVKQYHPIFEKIYPQNLSSLAENTKRQTEYAQQIEKNKKEQEERLERYKEYGVNNLDAMQKRFEEDLAKEQSEHEKRNAKEQKLVMHLKDRVFLKGEIIYQDSLYCLVLHASEVSKNARHFLTCVQADGKVLWEIKDNPPKILATTEEIYNNNMNAILNKDQLMLISNVFKDPGVVGLDLKTGKVLWEFMPLE